MKRALWAIAAASALVATQAGTAYGDVRVITTQVVAPFHLAYGGGSLYVADGGQGLVAKLGPGGALLARATVPQPGDVAGIAVGPGNTLAYTSTSYATGDSNVTVTSGGTTWTASASDFERANNPDRGKHYGIKNPTQCQIDAVKAAGADARYHGRIDAHAYDVARVGSGWVVADAGGNDLLKLDASGNLSLLTVLPVQTTTFTPALVAALHLPSCMTGVDYKFESVPTGLAMGEDGWLYVSLLPGGPEDPSFGARGSVYKVNPNTGQALRVAGGLAGATDVTIGDHGSIYVAELFAGQITRLGPNGQRNVVAQLPGVVSVEYADGHLYAGTMAPMDQQGNPVPGGHGSIVRVW